jgi:sugar lactone lactonase YvrE
VRRTVIATLGVLALVAAACSSSSGPKRPVAKPGQIVTVLSRRDGGLRDKGTGGEVADYEFVAVAPGGGDLYVGYSAGGERVVKVPRNGQPTTFLDCHTVFPAGMDEGKLSRRAGCSLSPRALYMPQGLAVDSRGTLYVTDFGGAVWAVTASGRARKVVGFSPPLAGGKAQVTGPPNRVDVRHPGPIVVGRDGTLYFDDDGQVVKLGRDGMVSVVAGNGGPSGFSGDGGPAVAAALDIRGLAVDADGTVYIGGGGRVRRVDRQGVITTFAGTGEEGDSGDGGPATQARFNDIRGLAFDTGGNLFVADHANHRVRRLGRDGTVTTAVGTGAEGNSGDGGPAINARLQGPDGLALDSEGNVYIADFLGERVRMVGAAGR